MKVEIKDGFLVWWQLTNPHLSAKKAKKRKINTELTEYVNDVLIEHIETMNSTLEGDDDSPDSGFMEE